MIPILFKIGPIPLYSYGLMMALGFWIGTQVSSGEYRRRGGDADLFWRMALLAFLSALFTSHFWWWLSEVLAGRGDSAEFFSGSGHVWFAGMIGGLAVGWCLTRWHKLNTLAVLDSAALGIPLGHGLGRIGCHLAGDGDWGTVTDAPWGVAYERAIVAWPHPPGVTVHPTALYETTAYALVFLYLLSYRRRAGAGALLGACLLLTSAARFAIEFWRLNPEVAFGLTEAQLVAIALSLLGAWLWFRTSEPAVEKPSAA